MEDGGKYGCTAGNSGGLEREEVFLHIAGLYFLQCLRLVSTRVNFKERAFV
jgi:hypothetical protein